MIRALRAAVQTLPFLFIIIVSHPFSHTKPKRMLISARPLRPDPALIRFWQSLSEWGMEWRKTCRVRAQPSLAATAMPAPLFSVPDNPTGEYHTIRLRQP